MAAAAISEMAVSAKWRNGAYLNAGGMRKRKNKRKSSAGASAQAISKYGMAIMAAATVIAARQRQSEKKKMTWRHHDENRKKKKRGGVIWRHVIAWRNVCVAHDVAAAAICLEWRPMAWHHRRIERK